MNTVISTFGAPSPLTVTRFEPGGYSDGLFVPGPSSEIEIYAVVIPVQARDLQDLPEGQRSRKNLWLYTETELLAADDAAGQPADLVTYNGKTYEIVEVQDRTQMSALAHYKVRVALMMVER